MTLRTSRAYSESEATNELERTWWNENAGLIANVWEMHREVSWNARAGYLRRAKQFFMKGRASASILELGCGSGWVGQSIVGPRLRVMGTDFSESQISLARSNAMLRGLGDFCCYTVADSVKWSTDMKIVDSVLIHAFMHHLDGAEVDGLLDTLRTNLSPGTRIWLYEPAFFRLPPANPRALSGIPRLALHAANRLVAWLSGFYRRHALLDDDALNRFSTLQQQAVERGWYLSPKEVPFDIDEFSTQLATRFRISGSYWATVYLIGWVFETNLLRHDVLRRVAANVMVPVLRSADERIALDEDYLRGSMVAPNHAFRVWECEVP